MECKYCICFDISFNDGINFFLPGVYIAEVKNGLIGYIQKKATFETADSFEIELSESTRRLIVICEDLKIETLHKKYNVKNKVKRTLQELLSESSFSKIFHQYISYKLNLFLEEIKRNDFPFSINLNRNDAFHPQKKVFSVSELLPKLHFQKLEDRIVYTLSLVDNQVVFLPSQRDTVVVLNSPAWILVDKNVFNLKELNGNKIRPFIKKPTVDILEKNSKIYFETFIKDIVKNVEIEADGFSVIQITDLRKCVIKPYYNFFSDQYLLDFFFYYEDFAFSFLNKKKFHSSIGFADYFEVIQIKRNFNKEHNLIEKLVSAGLKMHDFGFFSFNKKVNYKHENIQVLIENRSKLLEIGFEIDLSEVERKVIANDFGIVNLRYEENLDWFDLRMQIVCGEFTFPFVNIINNLKSNNPFFELPNGTFFLIPNEWFSKYKLLIEYASVADGLLLLKKSQFPIIDAIADHNQIEISHEKEVIFEASINLKAKLRIYQEEGVKWLIDHYNNNLGACLADDMGLGKTLQTLALLTYVKENLQSTNAINSNDLFSEVSSNQELLKALIIAPSSLIFNWKNESRKFTPFLKSIAFVGNDRKKIKNKLALYDLIFTSYSIAVKDILFFKNTNFILNR